MTHMVSGYPNYEESEKIFKTLDKYSEYIEVQFPFSDPIADWPIIEKANEISLENGSTTEKCFNFLEENIKKANAKILIMTYYNIVFNYGVEEFVKKAKELWLYGFIVPDIPFDEEDGSEFMKLCKNYDLHLVQIVSPSTKKERLKQIQSVSSWFLYAISKNMTTWSKTDFDDDFEKYVTNLRDDFDTEIWVWFWVKTTSDVKKVCKTADFAIIWSELIKVYNESKIDWLDNYVKNLVD